jgi:hypothetical protein
LDIAEEEQAIRFLSSNSHQWPNWPTSGVIPQIPAPGVSYFASWTIIAHGMPLAGAQPADAVPQIDPIIAFGSLHLTVVNGKSHCISLS